MLLGFRPCFCSKISKILEDSMAFVYTYQFKATKSYMNLQLCPNTRSTIRNSTLEMKVGKYIVSLKYSEILYVIAGAG